MTVQDPDDRPADALQVPPPFAIEASGAAPGVTLLIISGEIDLATSGQFREHVDQALAQGAHALVLDLGEVTFMDSTMLRELLHAHRDLEAAGGELILAAVQSGVGRLLEMTGTAELFTLVGTRDEAFARAGSR